MVSTRLHPLSKTDRKMKTNLSRIKNLTPWDLLVYWIRERESIRLNKEKQAPRPWTKDPILAKYRFCNVRREDDRVTQWVRHNWRAAYGAEEDVWFAMAVARFINWPDSLAKITPLPWNPARVKNLIKHRKSEGLKVWTSAYMIATNGKPNIEKGEYVVDYILTPLWKARKRLRPKKRDSLESYSALFKGMNGLGSFMIGQIIADTKRCDPNLAPDVTPDWFSWATPGPGSRRGMNRLHRRHPKTNQTIASWKQELDEVRAFLASMSIELDGQDVQNCLCEFDKYCRTLYQEGKPRQKYTPSMPDNYDC